MIGRKFDQIFVDVQFQHMYQSPSPIDLSDQDFDGLQIIGSNKPSQGDVTPKAADSEKAGVEGDDPEYDAYLDSLSGERRAEPFTDEEEGEAKDEGSDRSVYSQ